MTEVKFKSGDTVLVQRTAPLPGWVDVKAKVCAVGVREFGGGNFRTSYLEFQPQHRQSSGEYAEAGPNGAWRRVVHNNRFSS